MELAHYREYFCSCGVFLFNNGDIRNSTKYFGKNYIFVDERPQMEIIRRRLNIVCCKNCKTNLGTFLHHGDFWEKHTQIRFARHCILLRDVRINIFQIEVNRKTQQGVYQFGIKYGDKIKIPIGDNSIERNYIQIYN